MSVFLRVVVLVAALPLAAQTPDEVLRALYAAHVEGNAAKALTYFSSTADPLLRNEVRNDITWRCIDVRSLRLDMVEVTDTTATIEMIAHLGRTSRVGAPPSEDLERRTVTFVKENGAWRIRDMVLAEEKLVDMLVAAKTPAEESAAITANRHLVTPWLVRRLIFRAITLGRLGQGRPVRRLADLAQSLAATIDDRVGLANATAVVANSMRLPGTPSWRAIEEAEKALEIAEGVGDPGLVAFVTSSLAIAYMAVDGSSVKAERILRRALEKRHLASPHVVAGLASNLGVVLFARGDYAGAYQALIDGLAWDDAAGFDGDAAFKEIHIGRIMEAQNDPELAVEWFRRGVKRKATNKQFLVKGYLGLTRALHALGRDAEAQEAAEKALEIATQTPFPGARAEALIGLTELRIARGETSGIVETLESAVAAARSDNEEEPETEALLTLASFHYRNGRYADARKYAQEAITASAGLDYPRPERYSALMLAARAERALGNREKAIEFYQSAIDAVEVARGVVAGDERQRRLFFEPFHAAYTEVADLLLEKGSVAEALVFAERAKARVLLDAMGSERRSAESALRDEDRDRMQALVRALGEANKRIIALRASGDASPSAMEAATREQRSAQLALARFDSDVAARDPRLRAVRAGSAVIDPAALHALVPRDDFAILEYVVHERATHLFVVQRRGDGAAIEHHRIAVAPADLSARIDKFRNQLGGRSMAYRKSARALYDLLLAPAAKQLAGKRVLAIVPDGVLWRLPFEALVAANGRFVVESASCFYVPSITVYRDMLARQDRDTPRARTIAAFGNPAIDGTREHVRAVYRGIELGPLPDAETEVNEVARLWGANSAVYTRDEADEEAARAEMQRARIVHFAAHGLFDDANPMFSQIVLARDERSPDDGVLQAWELMRLDLAADLVVLSACDTARGRYGAGEGVIGMSWALFAGGCPSTVVAHWKVSSRSTSKLMVAFHRRLARDPASAFAKAEALRAAQLTMLRNASTAHPFHWAAFVLIGSA